MQLQREPEERTAGRPGQLRAALAVVGESVDGREPAEVGARALVGGHQVVRVAHQKGTDAIGQEEALVGVHA